MVQELQARYKRPLPLRMTVEVVLPGCGVTPRSGARCFFPAVYIMAGARIGASFRSR